MPLQKIWLPQEYRSNKKEYDVALLELETPVNFDTETCKNIEPACMHEDGVIEDGIELTIVGFGKFNVATDEKSNWLLKGTVKETPFRSCREQFSAVGTLIQENQICAHDVNYDTCQGRMKDGSCLFIIKMFITMVFQGDSGSPLLGFIDGKFYVVGLTSFGLSCGSKSIPSVYTRV